MKQACRVGAFAVAVLVGAPVAAHALTATCQVSLGTGRMGDGTPYADVSYSISFSSNSASGGYSISLQGPSASSPACAAGSISGGGESGSCRWLFSAGGSARFDLTASGGDQTGGAQCSANASGTISEPGPDPTPTPTQTPAPSPSPTTAPTATPTSSNATCNVSISGTGLAGTGEAYADVSYSVSLSISGAQGGFALTQVSGPQGTPVGGCAGGNFASSISGTCRWLFGQAGQVRFALSGGGGSPSGTAQCSATSGTATVPNPSATPSPTSVPRATPTASPSPSPTGSPSPTPTSSNATCRLNVGSSGSDGSGRPYAELSYSVSLFSPSAQGGFGLTQVRGAAGTPVGSCAGGNFTGSTSGGCRWTFEQGGPVEFKLAASGGNTSGSGQCSAFSGVVVLPPPGTPSPQASCQLGAPVTGTDEWGNPYGEVSFSVTLAEPGALGDYGIRQAFGPSGAPNPAGCEAATFVGRQSGTCRWLFGPGGGQSQFVLSAAGATGRGGSCSAVSSAFAIPMTAPTPPPSNASCTVHLDGATTVDESGRLSSAVQYNVSFTNPGTIGGYGITQVLGPPGTPTGSCAGGNITGSTSGSCRWSFPGGGDVQFRLTASGGGPNVPPASCSALSSIVRIAGDGGDPPPCTGTGCTGPATYRCDASIHDGYGGPIPDHQVVIDAWVIEPNRQPRIVAHEWGYTGPDGRVSVPVTSPVVAQQVTCEATDVLTTTAPRVVKAHPVGVRSGTVLNLDLVTKANFVDRVVFRGLRPNDGGATGRLYQSGAYDKPVVIPAPFDGNEQSLGTRSDQRLYNLFKELMVELHNLGFDVWLVNTTTGKNIHEQAGEFAQAIDYAARRGGGLDVIVAGYSLGGVVARLATARYEGDAAWRVALGVTDRLPVRLVVFGDAPLTGAQANLCVQQGLWALKRQGDANLNTCGAQQLLLRSVSGLGFQLHDSNWRSFYERGEPVYLDPAAACDRKGTAPNGRTPDPNDVVSACICDAGPPLLSVNGDGWAHGPTTVAFSDGNAGPQMCYGNTAQDTDRNQRLVCKPWLFNLPSPHQLAVGDVLYKMLMAPVWPDHFCYAEAGDVVGGSRTGDASKVSVHLLGFIRGGVEQYLAPTFIPYESALPPGAPFAETRSHSIQGIHGNTDRNLIKWTIKKMLEAFQ